MPKERYPLVFVTFGFPRKVPKDVMKPKILIIVYYESYKCYLFIHKA
jgi:hypothetical protein